MLFVTGNDVINTLTSSPVTLRVEVDSKVSTYSSFQVGSEREGYRLKQAVYSSGNAGYSLPKFPLHFIES